MKILLVCAGGMSTSILMKKMKEYWAEKQIDLTIDAVGLAEYEEQSKQFDIILVGPQVSYKTKEIKETTKLPCAAIESFDYAIANCENIMALAEKLYAEREKN